MANGRGYLGKISAIVSANTGDYVRKLDDSAKRTAAFARTIQSDLTKASREASRSIDAILTPLQRFERAIQNAASARLKFRGIDVAVRTIEDLRRSLAALDSDQEKEFAVRVSGLRNITELKNVLTDIREEDIDLAVNVGGVEGLRRLRNEVQEVNGQQINIRTERTAAELDTLIAKFSRLSPDRIREIRIAVEARQLDAAILKERQLVSLAKEIAAPLSASVAQFDKLTQEVQAGFIPALSAAQNRVEAVRDRIEAGGQIGQRAFRRIADEVRQTTEAIGRLAEAQRLVQSIGTGRSLRDTSPRQFDALTRAAEQSRRSEQVSTQVAAQFGLGDRQRRVRTAADAVDSVRARRESQELDLAQARRQGNTEQEARLQRQLEGTIQAEQRKTRELDRQLAVQLRQIEAAERLDEAQRTNASSPFATFRGPQGRPLAERFREQERVRAEEDRRAELAADQQRRREVATALLPPAIDLPPDPRQASLERTQALADRLGPDLASSSSALSRLESSTVSLKNQIDQLPAPLRAQFIPAIRQAENELLRLTAADDALPEDVERAAVGVRNLQTQIGQASRAAQQFGGSFREFADASDSRAAAGGLEFLRQTLLRATGDTRAAEDAVDRYSAALQRAATVPGGFRQFAGDLSRIRQQAVAAVAATEGVGLSARRINEGIRRTGDVARGSFGNTGLAIQQAAFIVDDFFSVTGGIEQRIRAIGNNISQLGFIVGGTYGLIVGVAVSVGAQAASALIKWANAGRSTENQTRALNEILQRQKTVVEELATAFNSLGQQIVSRGFSPAASAANELADRLKEIVRLQREAAESALTATSQGVAERRADQDVIRQRLESETNVGRSAALQRQLIEAQQSERETAARTRASASSSLRLSRGILNQDFAGSVRPVAGNQPTGEEVAALLRRISDEARQRANSRQGINRSIDDLSGSTRPEFLAAAQQLQQFARDLNLGSTADAIESQAASLQQAIELFKGAAERTLAGFNTEASDEASEFIRVLTDVRNRILSDINESINQNFNQTFQEADRATRVFADAQRAAQEAVERGVAGSEAVATDLDRASEAIKRSITALNEVQAGIDSQGRPAERTPEQIREIVNREQANVRQLQSQLPRAAEQTLQSRLGRVVGGERATAALQSLQGAESFANEYAGLTAQLQRAVELERIARERVARSSDAQSLAALAAARAASDLAAAAAESALAIDSEFSRLRQGLDDALQASRQQADEAQQRVSEAVAVGSRPSEAVIRRRDQAEAGFVADRSRIAQLQSRLAQDRSNALASPEIQGLNQRLEAIRTQREQAAERARVSGIPQGTEEANRLAQEQNRLENERVSVLQRLTAATRQAIEAETASSRLAAQGRELIATPGQRAGEELVRQSQAVRAAFEQSARLAGQPVDIARRQQAENRLFQDQVAQVAPIRVEFAREVQNAILSGPSRAALQASDATTVEGNRELSRLLRGDDPARDVNLIELQRQTQALEELLRIAREQGVLIAE